MENQKIPIEDIIQDSTTSLGEQKKRKKKVQACQAP